MGCPSSLIIDTSGGQSSKDIFVSFLFSCQVGGSTSLESSAHLGKKVSLQHWHLGGWGFLNQNSKIDNHGSWMSKIHWFPMLAVFLCLSFLSSLLCSLSHMGDNLSMRLFSRFPFLRNVERPSRKNRLIICLFYFDFLFLFILSFSLFLSQECRETE